MVLCMLYSKLENCTKLYKLCNWRLYYNYLHFIPLLVAPGRDADLPPEVPPRQQLWKRLFCLNCSLQLSNASESLCMQFMCEVFKGRAWVVVWVPGVLSWRLGGIKRSLCFDKGVYAECEIAWIIGRPLIGTCTIKEWDRELLCGIMEWCGQHLSCWSRHKQGHCNIKKITPCGALPMNSTSGASYPLHRNLTSF